MQSKIYIYISFICVYQHYLFIYFSRGPFLAVIELEKQRTDNAEESTKLLIESYVKYVKQFSNKPYCIFDSRPYLEELITKRGAKPEDILSQVTSACSGDAAAATTTTTALTTEQHTLIYAVQRMLGLWGSKTPAELAALAEEMVALHRSATTDATELALLVHLAFVDLHNAVLAKTGAKAAAAALVEDAAFLEGILAQKENNPQVRLCLLDVYHRLCAFKLETEHFWNEGLGVKSVLLESCSYLYIADALRYCNIRNTTSDLLSAVTTVHHENEANVPDYVLQGYTQQSYCKVAEIARFRAKLRRSALLALASAETPLLRLYGSQDPVATLASIGAIALPAQAPLDVLTDNSDYAASLAYGALSPIVGTEAKDSIRCKCYAKESINTLRASLDVLRATQDCDSSDKFAAAIDRLASAVAVGEKCSPVASWADVKPAAQRIFLSAARVLQTAAAAIKSKDGVAAFEAQAAEIVVLINAVEKVVAERAEALKSGDEDSAFSLLALDSVYDGVSALVTQALSWGSAITQVLTTFLPAKKNANSAYNKRRKTAAKSSALPAIKAKSAELSAAFKGLVAALKTLLEQLVALPNDAVVPAATEYPVKGVEPTVEFNSTLYVSYRETLQDFIDLVSRIKM